MVLLVIMNNQSPMTVQLEITIII